MKFTTFYFSGTGNTKWAAEEFKQIVEQKGHIGQSISIEKLVGREHTLLRDILKNADRIGFANPIYAANIPPIMRDFIQQVVFILEKKRLFKTVYCINTFGYANSFGPFAAKKLFPAAVCNLAAYVNLKLCNNASTPQVKMQEISREELEQRKLRAKAQMEEMADALLADKKYIRGMGPNLLLGGLIRKFAAKVIQNHYSTLSVSSERCSRCFQCVRECPTQSILYDDVDFRFLPGCTSCMRCYNHCPNNAILMNGKYADPAFYKRYMGPDKVE